MKLIIINDNTPVHKNQIWLNCPSLFQRQHIEWRNMESTRYREEEKRKERKDRFFLMGWQREREEKTKKISNVWLCVCDSYDFVFFSPSHIQCVLLRACTHKLCPSHTSLSSSLCWVYNIFGVFCNRLSHFFFLWNETKPFFFYEGNETKLECMCFVMNMNNLTKTHPSSCPS